MLSHSNNNRLTALIIGMVCLFTVISCSRHTSLSHQEAISQAISHYTSIKGGSWQAIKFQKKIRPGDSSASIAIIRQRLISLNDLSYAYVSNSNLYDQEMTIAVKQFQWRNGLNPSGIIDNKTLSALNITPTERLAQLEKSLLQWRKIPNNVGGEYIHVNIPSFQLTLVKDGSKIINMKVIVGKKSRPTPQLYSKVHTIVLNPTWNIPKSLIKEYVVNNQLKDSNFITDHNIQIFSDWKSNQVIPPESIDWKQSWNQPVSFRMTQKPGYGNALGKVKFIFSNDKSIYMHDTPQKHLFKKIERAYSSGCIRLERPFELAEYFLTDSQLYDNSKVNEILSQNKTTYIKIRKPIPLYVTYMTAWVDKAGHVHFREDIYKNSYESSLFDEKASKNEIKKVDHNIY
jgi:L,D-transpeptidase YcbB